MGKGTVLVDRNPAEARGAGKGRGKRPPPPPPAQLEREVELLQGDVMGLVDELDRRRVELTNWRLQLRRNALGFSIGVAGLLLVAGGCAGLLIRRRRLRARPAARARRRLHRFQDQAATRLREKLVAEPPSRLGEKVATVAAARISTELVKEAIARSLAPRRAVI